MVEWGSSSSTFLLLASCSFFSLDTSSASVASARARLTSRRSSDV